MPKAKYQFEDFFALVNNNYKIFVTTINEMLLQAGYKLKVQQTKSYGLHISYSQPKIKAVSGIIAYLLVRDGKLMIRVNAQHPDKYPGVLNRLPENIVAQIDKSSNCAKMLDPQKCWQGCGGYKFSIGDKYYHKCIVNCFLLDVNCESMPFLTELIEIESRERLLDI